MALETVETPPIFGYTIFCEEIRVENTGKLFYIGAYQGHMLVLNDFPLTIPRLAFAISLSQHDHLFSPQVDFSIFLPGDSETSPSIQFSPEPNAVSAANQIATVDPVHAALMAKKGPDAAYAVIQTNAQFQAVQIKEEGAIKVRADISGKRYRLGSLQVLRAPTQT